MKSAKLIEIMPSPLDLRAKSMHCCQNDALEHQTMISIGLLFGITLYTCSANIVLVDNIYINKTTTTFGIYSLCRTHQLAALLYVKDTKGQVCLGLMRQPALFTYLLIQHVCSNDTSSLATQTATALL